MEVYLRIFSDQVGLGFLDNETSWIAFNITKSVTRPGSLFNSRTKTQLSSPGHSPFIEGTVLGVSLQGALLDDEPHLLEEGSCRGRRLSLEQDADRLGDRVTQLIALTIRILTALGVLAISQSI